MQGGGGTPTLQTKSVTYTPTGSNIVDPITADTGYDGLSQVNVTVEGVVCTNLTAANIVSGVTVKIGTASDDDSVTSVTGTASGGGSDLISILAGTFSGAFSNSDITHLKTRALSANANMTSVTMPNLVSIAQRVFEGCTLCASFNLPSLTTCDSWAFAGAGSTTGTSSIILPELVSGWGTGLFENSIFTAIVLPKITQTKNSDFAGNNALLTAVDLRSATSLAQNLFNNRSGLVTVILGSSELAALTNITAFNNTPFASGGSGGTIYIPQSLYDHLGDGTSLDYKAASNWSTIDGYGTITWAKIEGSYYETHYADGTIIT